MFKKHVYKIIVFIKYIVKKPIIYVYSFFLYM